MGNEVMSAGQLLKQANQLKRAGRLDEAIALYYQAIEINPNFAWTYYELGDALAKLGDLDNSVILRGILVEQSASSFLWLNGSNWVSKPVDFQNIKNHLRKHDA